MREVAGIVEYHRPPPEPNDVLLLGKRQRVSLYHTIRLLTLWRSIFRCKNFRVHLRGLRAPAWSAANRHSSLPHPICVPSSTMASTYSQLHQGQIITRTSLARM